MGTSLSKLREFGDGQEGLACCDFGVTKSQTQLNDWTDWLNYSPPGSSVNGIFEARILGWVAIPFSRDLPDRGIEPRSSTLEADSLPSEPPGKPLISDCIVSYQKGLSCIESRSRCKGSIYLGLKLLQFLWNPLKGRLRSTYCILSHQRLTLLLLFKMQVGLYPSMVAYMATHIELSGRPTSPDYTGFLSLSFFFPLQSSQSKNTSCSTT